MATIVLVHGFWADGSSWDGVIGHLLEAGHDPLAVQLPLSSQDDDVATVHRALARTEGPVVLVGHSYGGVVITRAATADTPVAALTYVAAYGVDADEDVNALNQQFPPAGSGEAIRPSEDGHLWLDPELFVRDFAADVEPARAAAMARTQGPAALACLATFSDEPAWKRLPATYLVAGDDRTISPDAQRHMAQRMAAEVREVPSSHAVLVSHPRETAEVILLAAERLSPVAG